MTNDRNVLPYLMMIKKINGENNGMQNMDISPDRQRDGLYIIDPTCDIRGIGRMRFDKGVVVQKDCWLNIAFQNTREGPMIVIGEGTNIGRRSTISAANSIVIGKNVLMASDVLITDHFHEYRDVAIPIMHQGITTHEDRVIIGDDTWIGTHAVIMGNVTVGKHCVIGANSVVNRDIPDYCVAVGNPSRIIKTLDVRTGQWVAVGGEPDLDRHLAARSEQPSDDTGKA